MVFEFGDCVEHETLGKGIFLNYGLFFEESVVQFDENSGGEGDLITVATELIKKSEVSKKKRKGKQIKKRVV